MSETESRMTTDPVRARLAELRSVQTGSDCAADLLLAAVTAVLDRHQPREIRVGGYTLPLGTVAGLAVRRIPGRLGCSWGDDVSASFSVERMRRQLARNTEAAETANRHRWLDSLSPEHRARHERQRLGEICLECVTVNLSTFNGRMMSVADIMQTKAGPR